MKKVNNLCTINSAIFMKRSEKKPFGLCVNSSPIEPLKLYFILKLLRCPNHE